MNGARWSRWTGLAAMLGGTLCGFYGIRLALRPPGSPGGPYRYSDDLAPWIITGLLLIVVGLVGLYVQHAGRAGKLGTAAVGLAGIGAVLLGVGSFASWWIFFAGFLTVVSGLLVFGIATLFAGVIPLWASSLISLSAGCLFLFNTEDARAWLLVPFGSAWVGIGFLIWFRMQAWRHPLGTL